MAKVGRKPRRVPGCDSELVKRINRIKRREIYFSMFRSRKMSDLARKVMLNEINRH